MVNPIESDQRPSLISEVIKAQEEQEEIKEALKSIRQLLDAVLQKRFVQTNAHYNSIRTGPEEDIRRVALVLNPELTGAATSLTLVIESYSERYRIGSMRFEIQLRNGKRERLVIGPDSVYFRSQHFDINTESQSTRDASLSDIQAYQEIVEFADTHIPLAEAS
jgi:hypothetical protein